MGAKVRMTASEAFVETMLAHGVNTVFGIVGSAYMDALDLSPSAGIRFIPVAHEQNAAHMADGYSRVKKAITVSDEDQVGDAQRVAILSNKPTVSDLMLTQELAEPFRRDAFKPPVRLLDKYKALAAKAD